MIQPNMFKFVITGFIIICCRSVIECLGDVGHENEGTEINNLTEAIFEYEKNSSESLITYIHGGTEVDPPHKYPFMVRIESPECGGSLISNRYVLSAAHCVPKTGEIDAEGRVDRKTARSMVVGIGVHDLNENYEKIRAEEVIVHPGFNEDINKDIALIKLMKPVSHSKKVKPINLPLQTKFEKTGTKLISIGWGLTEEDKASDVLLETTLSVLPDEKCEYITSPSPYTLCAGGKNLDCHGDSGGPLFVEDEKKFYLIGVVSRGHFGCEEYPNIFTRVSYFKTWIDDNMDK